MTIAAGTVALNISYEELLLTVLLITMKKYKLCSFKEKHSQFKTRVLNPYPIYLQILIFPQRKLLKSFDFQHRIIFIQGFWKFSDKNHNLGFLLLILIVIISFSHSAFNS